VQTGPAHMSGFSQHQFMESMRTRGNYTCVGNLFWADPFYMATPSVPINRRGAPNRNLPHAVALLCDLSARVVYGCGS
jgi:hypothetical protein